MRREFNPSARTSRSSNPGQKRAVAKKWDSPQGDTPTKSNGRKGYASKKGDYVPREERDYDRSSRPSKFDSERKPRHSKTGEYQQGAKSQRPDRVARDQDRNRSFEGARAKTTTGKTFSQDVKLEKLESEVQHESFATFQEMDLPERLTQELARMGAATPFPIQAATIPVAMEGRDVLGRGKTGSGKTIAFGVPLVALLAKAGNQPRHPYKPRALVLAPTRELADQIDRTLSQLAKSVGFFTTTIYGGVPQHRQEQALKRGVDIAIATPGRLEDLMAQGLVDLSDCERVVLDEADHMCELGFVEPVTRILEAAGDS